MAGETRVPATSDIVGKLRAKVLEILIEKSAAIESLRQTASFLKIGYGVAVECSAAATANYGEQS